MQYSNGKTNGISMVLVIIGMCLLMCGCGEDCERENPTVILANNGTGKADIQIKTSGGNTENVNNIEIGMTSEKRSFAPGQIEFTIAIQGVNEPLEYNLYVYYCTDYTVKINPDNTVTGSAQDRE